MIKKLLYIIPILLLLAMPLYATDYYVKNGGNDAASGLDDDNAWETIAKVNGESFSGDDIIYFNRGDEWREQLTVPDSGTSGHQITFGAYGAGADPIINGADLVAGWETAKQANHVYKDDANLQALWLFENDADMGEDYKNQNDLTNDGVARSATHQEGSYSGDFSAAEHDDMTRAYADLVNINNKEDISFCFWVRFASLSDSQRIISFMLDGNGFDCRYDHPGSAGFEVAVGDGTNTSTQDSTYNVSGTGTWIHFAFTFDGSANTGRMYVDGSEDGGSPFTYTNVTKEYCAVTRDFYLGVYSDGASHPLNGLLDEVAFFDRILTSTEVGNIHGSGIEAVPAYYEATLNTEPSTVTTEPKIVCFDGTMGTNQASAVACDAEFDWFWEANVLYVYSTGDPDTDYDDPGIEAGARDYGIRVDHLDYITVQDLEVTKANSTNVWFDDSTGVSILRNTITCGVGGFKGGDNGCSSFLIDSNTIHHNLRNGIELRAAGSINNVISNNTVYRNCLIPVGDGGYGGIYLHGTGAGNVIGPYNITYRNGYFDDDSATGGYGAGIWLDTVLSGHSVLRNLSYLNSHGGYRIEDVPGCTVAYNISHEHTSAVYYASGFNIGSQNNLAPTSANLVYNNVSYGDRYGFRLSGYGDSTADTFIDNVFKNNIVTGYVVNALFAEKGAENDGIIGHGNVYTHNCFGAEAADFVKWGAATPDTYDVWETAYGSSTYSVEVDPLMTNPGGDDFTLNPHSPCVNAGTDVSLTEDYQGLKIRHAPDIGAHENQANAIFMSMIRFMRGEK